MNSRNSPLLGKKKKKAEGCSFFLEDTLKKLQFHFLPHFFSVLSLFFNLEIQPAHVFQADPFFQGLRGLLWASTILRHQVTPCGPSSTSHPLLLCPPWTAFLPSYLSVLCHLWDPVAPCRLQFLEVFQDQFVPSKKEVLFTTEHLITLLPLVLTVKLLLGILVFLSSRCILVYPQKGKKRLNSLY